MNKILHRERRHNTLTVLLLLFGGLVLLTPLSRELVFWEEVTFCVRKKCWNGVRHLVAVELRNNMELMQAVKVVKVIPSDDALAPYFALGGTALLITAASISHKLTQDQAAQLLSSLRGIKGRELREDMQEEYALDLHRHTLASTAQVEQEVISREAMTTLASIQSEQEQQLAYLEGQQQGEIDLLEHANKVAELRLSLKEKEEKLKVTAQPKNPKEQLIKKMKGHEGGWLWDVLNSLKPLWLVGNQGSGKTTAGATLALARKVLLEREVNMIVDRHGDSENGELWKLFPEAMLAISADEIGQSLIESIQDWGNRMKMKPKPPVVQVIVDEFTALRELVGDISDTWFKLSCTDTRKGQVQVIGITHNTTNESFPAGTVGTRKAGTILLEKFSANNETPLPRVVIRWGLTDSKGNPLEDEERTWPGWFNIDELNGVT
ncbi:hypothetical protein [Cylindrospermopsis curvispora]|uniref:Uncharacterized protein n=1 Tax=Cylindrospermopsis curvispora GIHE-G1 TaxID=2666332 RepID=A0A7H0F5M6_9CYAN|nr:hypothetical protein [Cylindrospermopsis curvispora]QNP31342.1 hypothetical protein IAR63_17835 [Cylindrospermopsis curvispora GIHE-G1]